MRLSALLILTQLLLLVSVVHADPMADRFVELLQDVCVSPATPEGIIEAGNRRAAAEGWKLIESGPAPMRLVDPFNGPKLSFESSWMTSLPDAPIARLLISIVRPEIPGVRSNVCMVEPAAAIDPGELARTLERRFGPLIIRATRQLSGSHKWFLMMATGAFPASWSAGPSHA